MDLPEVYSLEIKKAKTGTPVPVINGVHLHSAYNPQKEADSLIEKYDELLKSTPNALVLGLGMGYHVMALQNKLSTYHPGNWNIFVIDPYTELYDKTMEENEINTERVRIHVGKSISELYHDLSFVKFLVSKPAVISHAASFNLYENYFREFLTHKEGTSMDEISNVISSPTLRDYLTAQDKEQNFEEFLNMRARSTQIEEFDHLALALKEMSQH